MAKPSVIFVCTGNCCRSQLAEAIMRQLAGDRFEVLSAGSEPAGYVHPLVEAVAAEMGLDIQGQVSKGLDEFADRQFDYVVTVCDHAAAKCPTLRGRLATLHWPLEDPAAVSGGDAAALQKARGVGEELHARLVAFLRTHSGTSEGEP
jgi:arsenate reductase